eukprot:1156860-Pelagomonas_calceolata.AAC.2
MLPTMKPSQFDRALPQFPPFTMSKQNNGMSAAAYPPLQCLIKMIEVSEDQAYCANKVKREYHLLSHFPKVHAQPRSLHP